MITVSRYTFQEIRALLLVGLFAIGLMASTAVPVLAQGSGTWKNTGSMNSVRDGHTATLLRNGEVLAAGGVGHNSYLTSAELYAPARGKWAVTGSMTTARNAHTATLLDSGDVLVAGGDNANNFALSSAELYNPSTGQFTPTGSMTAPRVYCTATLLPNGQVLAAGGQALQNKKTVTTLSSTELYDPATGIWTKTGSLNNPRVGHTATLLNSGELLVAGGYNGTSNLASAELYNPATGKWTATGSMSTARAGHTATLLQNGEVLVVDGSDGTNNLGSAELYDPATGHWTLTGSLGVRAAFTATLLDTGKLLVAGGQVGHYPNTASTNSAELYDPSTGIWTATGSMNTARQSQTATRLANGQVLVAGGQDLSNDQFTDLVSAELYTP